MYKIDRREGGLQIVHEDGTYRWIKIIIDLYWCKILFYAIFIITYFIQAFLGLPERINGNFLVYDLRTPHILSILYMDLLCDTWI